MTWQAIQWAQDKGKAYELDPTTRFVLMTLGGHDHGDNYIYPALSTLEMETGLSERQIRRCIKKLIAVGLLDYGDQSVLTENPRYRNDRLPKVYKFCYIRDELDVSSVGKMPQKKRRPWSRKPKPEAAPPAPPAPVDNRPPRHRRPDNVSRTTGQTGGHNVHQSCNPLNNPYAAADAAPPTDVDWGAVRALRQAARDRLAARGILITEPLFALP